MAIQVLENGVTYNVKKHEVTVVKLTNKSKTKIIIPEIIHGKPVTKIATRAFAKTNICAVELPRSIKDIGASAFENCHKLKTVFQNGVVSNAAIGISQKAFKNCSNLQELCLIYSLLILGSEVFDGCTQLRTIPSVISVSILTKNMFNNCVSLTRLEFDGPHIAKIDDGAFNNCIAIEEIVLRCKVELSNYLKLFLKNVDIKTTSNMQNILDLAYEGYSITVLI